MLDTIERMAAVTARKLSAQPNAGKPPKSGPQHLPLFARVHGVVRAAFILHNVRVRPRLLRPPRRSTSGRSSGRSEPRSALSRGATQSKHPARAGSRTPTDHSRIGRPARPSCPDSRPQSHARKNRRSRTAARGTFVTMVELAAAARLSDPIRDRARAPSEGARRPTHRHIPEVTAGAPQRAGRLPLIENRRPASKNAAALLLPRSESARISPICSGAHAIGLRNVLLVTAIRDVSGDYPDATAVFDRRFHRS